MKMLLISIADRDLETELTARESFRVGRKKLEVRSEEGFIRTVERKNSTEIWITSVKNNFKEGLIEMKVILSPTGHRVNIIPNTFNFSGFFTYFNGSEFFLSSSVLLLKEIGISLKEERKNLPEFFTFRNVISPYSLFRNIGTFPFGKQYIIRSVDDKLFLDVMERVNLTKKKSLKDEHSVIGKVSKELKAALSIMEGTGLKSSMLFSGGLDSSVLYKIYRDEFGDICTYSSGYPFEEEGSNIEKEYALSASRSLGINHSYIEISTEEYIRNIIESIKITENPLSGYQTPLLYGIFKKGVREDEKIIYTANGADSIFGDSLQCGLFVHDRWTLDIFRNRYISGIMKRITRFTGRGSWFIRRFLPIDDPDNIIWSFSDYGDHEWVNSFLNPGNRDIIRNSSKELDIVRSYSLYDILSYYYMLRGTHFAQTMWSRLAQSRGKILSSPFMDINLINFMNSIDDRIKLKEHKRILRKIAYERHIPVNIIERPKSGFAVNSQEWALRDGPLEPLTVLTKGIFDMKDVRKVQSKDRKKASIFWSMLNYSIWKRLFIDGQDVDELLDIVN